MSSSNIDPDNIDALLDSMSEVLLEIGMDNQILKANKSTESLLGLNADELTGTMALDFARQFKSSSSLAGNISDALSYSSGSVSGDCTFLRADGKELYLSWTLNPLLMHGVVNGKLLTMVDLTDRHELRLALLHEREDFLAVLNHRLRTPILATDRIIKLLQEGQFGQLSEQQQKLFELVGQNVTDINRLMIMIMDIYRYRSATKELNLREVRIGQLIADLLPKINSHGLAMNLKIDCPQLCISCDEEQINSMLSHVIENAVKYARSKVTIQISQNEDQILSVKVEDDGKGIEEDDIKNLFERFYLVSANGKYAPVTGAGLCLCNEIAKAHGGRIRCRSKIGCCTCFEIKLPLSAGATSSE